MLQLFGGCRHTILRRRRSIVRFWISQRALIVLLIFVCLPGIPSSAPWPTGGVPCTPFHSSVHDSWCIASSHYFPFQIQSSLPPFTFDQNFFVAIFVTASQNLANFQISGCSGDSFSKTAYVYQLWISTPGPLFWFRWFLPFFFFLFFSFFLFSPVLPCGAIRSLAYARMFLWVHN